VNDRSDMGAAFIASAVPFESICMRPGQSSHAISMRKKLKERPWEGYWIRTETPHE
jgi:hypothetical protein